MYAKMFSIDLMCCFNRKEKLTSRLQPLLAVSERSVEKLLVINRYTLLQHPFSLLFQHFLQRWCVLDINECLANNGGCSSNAICNNNPGSFSCVCGPGYVGNGFSCAGVMYDLLYALRFSN